MTNAHKIIFTLVLLVIIVWGGYFVFNKEATNISGETTVVGVIVPLSGEVASLGEAVQRDIQLAGAKNISFEFQDDQCDAKKALSAYDNLKLQGVKIFYVGCSGSVLALAPHAKENGDLIVTAYSGASEIRKTGPEVIRFNPDALTVADVMKEYFPTTSFKKFGLFYEQQDYAQSLADSIRPLLGDRLTVVESYDQKNSDYRTQLLKFKSKETEAIIIVPVSDKAAQVVYQQLQELKINKPVIGDVNLCDYPFKPSDYGLRGVCWKAELDTIGYNEFIANHKNKYNTEPPYPFYDALTYDVVLILDRIVGAVTDKNNIVIALQEELLKGQLGAVTDYEFEPNGEVIGGKYLKMIEFQPQ